MKTTIHAYAKINLFLDITGRRADGYHTITGVMQAISLHDDVTVEVTPGGCHDADCGSCSCCSVKGREIITLTCSNPEIPVGEKNLGWRAAKAFLEATGMHPKVSIHIEKRIPAAAGMAGGSTNAAAVLRALNDLTGRPLSEEKLRRIGLSLGADVPFCLAGGAQITEGVGEELTPCAALPPCHIVVACGGEGVSTPGAYRALDEMYANFDGSVYTPRYEQLINLRAALDNEDLSGVAANAYNLFETAILPTHRVAGHIRETLAASGAVCAMMSGSGPSVFGLFDDTEAAVKAAEVLRAKGIPAWVCEGVR